MKNVVIAVASILFLLQGCSSASTPASVAPQPAAKVTPTQIQIPAEKAVQEAVAEAMPAIRDVLNLHQCMRDSDNLRLMNKFAVPGSDMTRYSNAYDQTHTYGLPVYKMQYHNRSQCLHITSLQDWSMPALNALVFRAVYLAEDSGETATFEYSFRKMPEGNWRIAEYRWGGAL